MVRLNGQATMEMTEKLFAMFSKLSDEVAHLKIDNVELKIKLVISKGLLLDPMRPPYLEEKRSKFPSGHFLLCPTVKLQQAGRSVGNLRLPARKVCKYHLRKSCQLASDCNLYPGQQSLQRMVSQRSSEGRGEGPRRNSLACLQLQLRSTRLP
jgi:hypothetical protein